MVYFLAIHHCSLLYCARLSIVLHVCVRRVVEEKPTDPLAVCRLIVTVKWCGQEMLRYVHCVVLWTIWQLLWVVCFCWGRQTDSKHTLPCSRKCYGCGLYCGDAMFILGLAALSSAEAGLLITLHTDGSAYFPCMRAYLAVCLRERHHSLLCMCVLTCCWGFPQFRLDTSAVCYFLLHGVTEPIFIPFFFNSTGLCVHLCACVCVCVCVCVCACVQGFIYCFCFHIATGRMQRTKRWVSRDGCALFFACFFLFMVCADLLVLSIFFRHTEASFPQAFLLFDCRSCHRVFLSILTGLGNSQSQHCYW